MIKNNIFVKIDTVFIYQVTNSQLILLEDEYFIFKKISQDKIEEYFVLFENNINKDIISKYRFDISFKNLIINNHINNSNIIDFALYIHSIEDENMLNDLKIYGNLENLYKDFIIHLNKFRKEQILKYTFNIKQRRISRKKLAEIKEAMKHEVQVNWKYEDIF